MDYRRTHGNNHGIGIRVRNLPPSGVFDVATPALGSQTCTVVEIENVHASLMYTLFRPFFVGNVYFSVPQSQLPLFIPPGSSAQLQCCVMPTLVGSFADTLVLPDTCFATFVPFTTNGPEGTFLGASRCSVIVQTTQSALGGSYTLFAPFPQPASDFLYIQLQRQLVGKEEPTPTAVLVDIHGEQHQQAVATMNGSLIEFRFATSRVQPGMYVVRVSDAGIPIASIAVSILR
jgi:hypothetical protein